MENREKPSWGIRVFGPLIFIVGGLAALIWFFYRVFRLIHHGLSDIVVFDKGSFYMLGVGVGMSVLAAALVQEGWFDRVLTPKQTKYFTRLLVISLVLLVTIPHLVHFSADMVLKSEGYSVCEPASHQWLFVRDIVYISGATHCDAGLKARL